MTDSIECLVGQLISSTKSLQHELTELKRDIQIVHKEDAAKIDNLVKTVEGLVGLKNKGVGILVAVAVASSFISWCATYFFTE